MHQETIHYLQKDLELHGHLVYDDKITGPRPAVLVAHAWMGQDDFARKKAEALAEAGYVGFAVDLYGHGQSVETNDEAARLMRPLFQERALLQERMRAGFDALKRLSVVDKSRIGAIGFCFGGLAAIELFRSGAELAGVCAFHAVLGNTLFDIEAKTVKLAKNVHGSILMLHGHDDPLVSQQDIEAIQNEFTQAEIDWQMHIYGQTSHAFTNPEANDKKLGLLYNSLAEKRSWLAMNNFFSEVFNRQKF